MNKIGRFIFLHQLIFNVDFKQRIVITGVIYQQQFYLRVDTDFFINGVFEYPAVATFREFYTKVNVFRTPGLLAFELLNSQVFHRNSQPTNECFAIFRPSHPKTLAQ